MRDHAFVNVVIPFDASRLSEVDDALRGMTDRSKGNQPVQHLAQALEDTACVHFMSITAVGPRCPSEEDDSGPLAGKAHLVIELSADGGAAEALSRLVAKVGRELSNLLTLACAAPGSELLEEYLLRHHRKISAKWGADALGQVFTGSPGMSVKRIRGEAALTHRIAALIDREQKRGGGSWHALSARARIELLRNHLWDEGKWKWAFVPERAPCLAGDPRNRWDLTSRRQQLKALGWGLHVFLQPLYLPLALVGGLVHFLTASPYALLWLFGGTLAVLLLLFGLGYAWLRRLEKSDPVEDLNPREDRVEALLEVENFCAQNHLASVSRLKPPWLRRVTLLIAFIAVGAGRFLGAPGFLGKNGVIHFARWMRLPGTDQLLFWSNFDNTWASYVGDFIADAPSGVTAIWSNCVGFPRTRALQGEGAEDRDRLVRWARRQQHPTTFWYSAYPRLTADRIRINAAIRQGLVSADTDADVRDWFALSFGSRPRPADALQTTQIPTLVLGSLKGLRHAECRMVHFGSGFQGWMSAVAEAAAYGEAQPAQTRAAVVAFSASGLGKLGIAEDSMATFPVAFRQNMWPASRARALGDEGANAPKNWDWGGSDQDVPDAVLLLYGAEDQDLDALRQALVLDFEKLKDIRTRAIPLVALTGGQHEREVFGFADGISQPVVRGTPRSRTHRDANDLVAAGEIVLGYPDLLGRIPPSPSVAARDDPARLLPADVERLEPPRRHPPEFSRYDGGGRRDVGANGTFLVVRQLEQNEAAFDAWLDETLDKAEKRQIPLIVTSDGQRAALAWGVATQGHARSAPMPRPRDDQLSIDWSNPQFRHGVKELLAAKLFGRWKDGSSLVRYPLASSGRPPDNDFLFGAEDPRGLACPFGAHIRRANPRDARFHGSKEEIDTVNRHRILRVGRLYGPGRRGLLFMCLNADIERQFEFVQKTWLLNPNMHGLENEVDPLLGTEPRTFTLPTPSGVVRLAIDRPFVTVKGGGYFFLPGRTALQYLASLGRG